MGVLLAFMFVWNMVGALVLLPALAYFLLPQRPVRVNTPAPATFAARRPLKHKAPQRLEVRHDS
jgi:hypothetical protein